MQAVIFGAGNIGRGFLGPLVRQAGYAITFVDIDHSKVELIHTRQEYPVFVVSERGVTSETVVGVDAVALDDHELVSRAVIDADLILTAVGKNALPVVAAALAKGFAARHAAGRCGDVPVVVIACENVADNTAALRAEIVALLDHESGRTLDDQISFPNCVVDRIVPNTLPREAAGNPLAVAVEDYFQLAVDRTALHAPLMIPGIELVDDLAVLLEQKLFTLNMAHALVGYWGFLRGYRYVHEVMDDTLVLDLLAGAFEEVESVLLARHTTLTSEKQAAYARSVVVRFRNPYLCDEVVRVARSPKRKLSATDRLVAPARLALATGMVPAHLSTGIAAALHYDYSGDSEAQELVRDLREQGVVRVLEEVSHLQRGDTLTRLVAANYRLRAL